MEEKIVIKNVRVHGATGYIEVDVVAVQEDGNSKIEGPVKTYGTDAHCIQASYSGNVQLWLDAVKGMHQEHSGHHRAIVDQIVALKGKAL
jgi:hypothetical protein